MHVLRPQKHGNAALPVGSVVVLLILLLAVAGCASAVPAGSVAQATATQTPAPSAQKLKATPVVLSTKAPANGQTNNTGPGGLAIPTPRPGDKFQTIAVGRLPAEAVTTLTLIAHNGPFPYSQDGVVFQNREGLLPRQADGYYHEYTVKTPGASDRGARRIIRGGTGELFYTDDHYASFKRIVP